MKNTSSLLETARRAVEVARKHGATEAVASVAVVREVTFNWRDGHPERVSEATTQGLSLEVYADGRYAAVMTSDMLPATIEKIAVQSIDMARALAADPYRKLPDPSLYAGRSTIDLDLEDKHYNELTAEKRRNSAKIMEEAARSIGKAADIISVTTDFSDTLSESASASSNGFEGVTKSTIFAPYAEVSVKDPDGRRPEDYDYAVARHRRDLPSLEEIGKNAAQRAIGCIGATKGKSGRYTIAIDPRAAGRLLGRLLGPLSGSALQQKHSMFEGREGQVIGSPLLDIIDDPFLVRGIGSRLFDEDGIAAKKLPLFEKGVLKNFFLDNYYARKLGRSPTTGRASNIVVTPGEKSQAELLKDMGNGLLITNFLGGNSNGTTGDFSLGIQGKIVRDGIIAEPFSEMNLSGNHLEFWKQLAAIGNDPYPWSSTRVPTLVFDGVQVAGL